MFCFFSPRLTLFTSNFNICVINFAGASHYGVGDLEALAKDTHKFESRYLDTMIAPYDEEHKKIYHDRSPIHYVQQLSCALALFQGDEDQVRIHRSR